MHQKAYDMFDICFTKYVDVVESVIQMCSGITCGRMLIGELYAQRFQNLIYLHLFTDCFIKISPQSPEQIQNFVML